MKVSPAASIPFEEEERARWRMMGATCCKRNRNWSHRQPASAGGKHGSEKEKQINSDPAKAGATATLLLNDDMNDTSYAEHRKVRQLASLPPPSNGKAPP
jgi:hypothetical protein